MHDKQLVMLAYYGLLINKIEIWKD
jgi:hypothetical protein